MNEREYQRRIRRYRYQCDTERNDCERQGRRAIISCLITTIAALIICCMMVRPSQASTSNTTSYSSGECSALMRWPVSDASIMKRYQAPEKQWLSGHRGNRSQRGGRRRTPCASGRHDCLCGKRGRQIGGHHTSRYAARGADFHLRAGHHRSPRRNNGQRRAYLCARRRFFRPLRGCLPALGAQGCGSRLYRSGGES